MWISKRKHQSEINRVRNEEMFNAFDRESEIHQERDIEQLKRDINRLNKRIKKLDKIIKEGY
jgi:predicted  nucleic acid-binding Zn-ribbon protein